MIETLKFPVSRIKIHEPELDLEQAYDAILGVVGKDKRLMVLHHISEHGSFYSASWYDQNERAFSAWSLSLLLAKVRRVMNGTTD